MIFLTIAQTNTDIGGVAGWLVDLMDEIGGPGAAIAIAAENLFPPLPSELFLPLAGFTASQPGAHITLLGAILWTTFGSLAGAVALYWVGAQVGRDRVRSWAERVPLVKVSDFDRTEAWFERHGTKAVLIGRMIPIFRSLISLPAGVARMPLALFMLLTVIGSAIWNSLLIVAGYQLGSQYELVEKYAGLLSNLVVLVIAVAVAMLVYRRVSELREGER